jgi:hypothetical protein
MMYYHTTFPSTLIFISYYGTHAMYLWGRASDFRAWPPFLGYPQCDSLNFLLVISRI